MFKVFSADDAADQSKVAEIKDKRDKALGLFQDIALKDRSNALGVVKQQVSLERLWPSRGVAYAI